MTDMFLGLASFAFFCLIGASVFSMIAMYRFNEMLERAIGDDTEERASTVDEGWMEFTPAGYEGEEKFKVRYRRSDVLRVTEDANGRVYVKFRDADKRGFKRKFFYVEVEEDYATICERLTQRGSEGARNGSN